jgi:phosphatidate cytidylyltransferase
VLQQRILTAAVLLPAFLAALFLLPRLGWSIAVLLVALLAAVEWAKLAGIEGASRAAFLVSVLLGCIATGVLSDSPAGSAVTVAGVAFWLIVAPLWLRGVLMASAVRLAIAGWVVLVCAWHALVVLRANPGRLLALVAVVWIADTAAYFTGRRFGRRKLAPNISPGKTWEGVIGAAIAVGVYYSLLWHWLELSFLGSAGLKQFLLIAAITILSIEGDLFESWMKRRAGVKDSGTILPGHGGVLDRIDGIVAVLPLTALVSQPLFS